MENKRPGHISEKELDNLLNQVFLNQDFENNSTGKETLAMATKHAMQSSALSRIFNIHWLDRLFLLLSAFICLSSFYRYMNPSLNAEEKKSNPGPHLNPVKKEMPLLIQPAKDHSTKSTGEVQVNGTSSSIIRVHFVKNSPQRDTKRDNNQIITEIQADSISVGTEPDAEVQAANTSSANLLVDSSTTVFQNNIKAPLPTATVKKTSSTKKNDSAKIGKKSKAKKSRGRKVFHRNGTFRLKGNKYGKSSRP